MKSLKGYICYIAIAAGIVLFPGCRFNDSGDSNGNGNNNNLPILPLFHPLEISIDWDTDEQTRDNCSGKATVTLQLKCADSGPINPEIYPLAGNGTGFQFDCHAEVEPPSYVDNLYTPDFTVRVTSGSYWAGGQVYGFTIDSEDAEFEYDVFREDHTLFGPVDLDELKFVLSDVIFELRGETGYIQTILGETILGTSYGITARFIE